MKKNLMAAGMFFLLVGGRAFAEEASANTKESALTEESLDAQPHPTHWEFLGCVHSQHDCDHLAHGYGYHYHTAQYDHYTCGHDHLACYGR